MNNHNQVQVGERTFCTLAAFVLKKELADNALGLGRPLRTYFADLARDLLFVRAFAFAFALGFAVVFAGLLHFVSFAVALGCLGNVLHATSQVFGTRTF